MSHLGQIIIMVTSVAVNLQAGHQYQSPQTMCFPSCAALAAGQRVLAAAASAAFSCCPHPETHMHNITTSHSHHQCRCIKCTLKNQINYHKYIAGNLPLIGPRVRLQEKDSLARPDRRRLHIFSAI